MSVLAIIEYEKACIIYYAENAAESKMVWQVVVGIRIKC